VLTSRLVRVIWGYGVTSLRALLARPKSCQARSQVLGCGARASGGQTASTGTRQGRQGAGLVGMDWVRL